jgi:hypothetical protein
MALVALRGPVHFFFVYYKSIKRELKKSLPDTFSLHGIVCARRVKKKFSRVSGKNDEVPIQTLHEVTLADRACCQFHIEGTPR